MKRLLSIFIIIGFFQQITKSQDISLVYLQGHIAGTFVNPAIKLDKKWNISIAGISALLGSDGKSINQLTSKNANGSRYIDIDKVSKGLDDYNNIFFNNNIHTLDLGFNIGAFNILMGHSLRSTANLKYPKGLVELAAFGNAAFIGQQIQIGPILDVMAYNELYLGAQKTVGNFTLGLKGKLTYGTSNISTENSDIIFTTKEEYYQLQLKNNYLVRSSSLLRYNGLDSITLDFSGYSFDNFFYNNRGLAIDLGASFKLNNKLTLSASALDIGSINWDFFPRKYESKGTFTFEGVDLIEYLGDTTTIGVRDTLLNLIDVKSGIEQYSTPLNSTFTLSGTYQMNDQWSFSALYMLKNDFGYRKNVLSVSAMTKISFFNFGTHYTITKNNYSAIGLYGKVKIGPVHAYLSTDNIVGIFKPLDSKSASLRLGLSIQI